MKEKQKEALTTIDKQVEELDGILSEARTEEVGLTDDRIKRWKDRTIAVIATSVGIAEAERFRKSTEPVVFSIGGDPYSDTADEIKVYKNHLLALTEEITKHPEFILTPKPTTSPNISQLSKNFNFHPEITEKCGKLFDDRNYPEAVEKGFKVVRDKLRKLTDFETGSEAFGKGKLKVLGASAPHTEEDFNEGVKFLTMAIDKFRNEKAHTADAKIDDPVRAYEYLRLSSLAMNLLDQATLKS